MILYMCGYLQPLSCFIEVGVYKSCLSLSSLKAGTALFLLCFQDLLQKLHQHVGDCLCALSELNEWLKQVDKSSSGNENSESRFGLPILFNCLNTEFHPLVFMRGDTFTSCWKMSLLVYSFARCFSFDTFGPSLLIYCLSSFDIHPDQNQCLHLFRFSVHKLWLVWSRAFHGGISPQRMERRYTSLCIDGNSKASRQV